MRRMTAVGVIALVLALTGCGQVPRTVALAGGSAPAAELPAVCLGSALDLALGYGSYAVPVGGVAADVTATPSWQNAALQLAPASRVAAGSGPYTLCSYLADHPTPFSTRGGDDALMCVLVGPSGDASLVSAGAAGTDPDCAAAAASD